jgi:hypothetical protein
MQIVIENNAVFKKRNPDFKNQKNLHFGIPNLDNHLKEKFQYRIKYSPEYGDLKGMVDVEREHEQLHSLARRLFGPAYVGLSTIKFFNTDIDYSLILQKRENLIRNQRWTFSGSFSDWTYVVYVTSYKDAVYLISMFV